MTLVALAAVPAAPLLLAAASPAQPPTDAPDVARARDAVAATLGRLPAAGTAVLLVPGDEPAALDASWATLASYGLPRVRAAATTDDALLDRLAAAWRVRRAGDGRLDGDAAVLALLLAEARPALALATLVVPCTAEPALLGDLADGLRATLEAHPPDAAVLATGDLAATLGTTSPGYETAGASGFDRAAVRAVRAGDVEALTVLGPAEALRVQARGWAPLTVLLHLATTGGGDVDPPTPPAGRAGIVAAYLVTRGVGGLAGHATLAARGGAVRRPPGRLGAVATGPGAP